MSRMEVLNKERGVEQSSEPAGELDLVSLWQAYTVSRDETLRNRLLVHYVPLSKMIARHIHGRMPKSIEFDDLAQAAILGLRSAIGSFKADRGVPFEHYCGPRVRGAVLDYLRSLDWAPRMLRSRVQRLQEMTRQMEMETGATPTDEEISAALNVPMGEIESLKRDMNCPLRVQITSRDREGGTDEAVNLDLLPDRGGEDPEREAQRDDLREFLVKGLSRVERSVMMMYYYDNMSLREIGKALDLCESRASQIHQAIIGRLRERMHRIGGQSFDD